MRIFKTLGVAAAMSASLGAGAAVADEIRVGICVSWPGYAMLEIARQQNLMPSHELAITIFEDPLGGHSALAAGQLDVYGCTAEYTPIIVDQGFNVVNVAFLNPSYGVDHIILSPDAQEDVLAGKNVSAPQAYIGHLLMGMWLNREGVDLDSVCGGRGICSKCQITPAYGEFPKHGVSVAQNALSEWNSEIGRASCRERV